MKKRLFVLTLVLCLAMVFLPGVGLSARAAEGSGNAGTDIVWTLDSKGTLTITGTGEITEKPWMADFKDVIKNAVIGEGITSICGYAFDGCKSLTEVTFPSTLKSIGTFAFEGTGIKNVTLPEGFTTLGSYAFRWTYVDSLTIPSTLEQWSYDPFPDSVGKLYVKDLEKWLSYSFANGYVSCEELYVNGALVEDVVVPSSITELSANAFYGYQGIKTVVIPESVKTIGAYAFYNCGNLETVTLKEGVTAIHNNTFAECPKLTSFTFPASVQVINSYAFDSKDSTLAEVKFLGNAPLIANTAFSNVKATALYSAGNASWTEDVRQNYGGSLTWSADASIPGTSATGEAIRMDGGSCGDSAVWELDSKGLLNITGTGDITEKPWMENYASIIKKVAVGEGITSICGYAFDGCKSLTEVTFPSTLKSIGTFAFEGTGIKNVTLPEGFTTLGSYAFRWTYVDSLTIPSTLEQWSYDPFPDSVGKLYVKDLEKWLSYSFANGYVSCEELYVNGALVADVVVPSSITELSANAFYGYQGIKTVVIPESVKTIGAYAFYNCGNLETVTLKEGVTTIHSNTFAECPKLTSFTFPASVQVINSYAFDSKDSTLAEVKFLGNAPLIANTAFSNVKATALYSAGNASWTEDTRQNYGGDLTWRADNTIPSSDASAEPVKMAGGSCGENVTWELSSKGLLAVSGTGEITEKPWMADFKDVIKNAVIGEGITSICGYAFDGCKSLTEVTFPSTLKSIGTFAFEGTGIKNVTLPESFTTLGSYAFRWTYVDSLTIPSTLEQWSYDPFPDSVGKLYVKDLEKWLSYSFANGYVSCEELYVNGALVADVVVPSSITELSANAFYGYQGIKTVVIPESVKTIGAYAFYNCGNLETVTLKEGVTAIHSNTFAECPKLTSFTFPASVQVINSYAFDSKDSTLAEVKFLGNAPLIANNAFSSVTATAYYSSKNTSWTQDFLQNYGGNLTWVADGSIAATGDEEPVRIIASGTCGSGVVWTIDSVGTMRISAGEGKTRALPTYEMDDFASAENTPWYTYRDQITQVLVESSVKSVGSNAFAQCENLKEVTVEEGVGRIGENAFAECANLTDVAFLGQAPVLENDCFRNVTATLSHPSDDETWTEEAVQNAGGQVTLQENTRAYVSRMAGDNRFYTAFKVADEMKTRMGVEQIENIVIASGSNFADALSGSYLATVKKAPILLAYKNEYNRMVADYVAKNLVPGGTVYILGGTSAVAGEMDTLLADVLVKRLAGANRFETNLMILEEAGVAPGEEILVCTATNFADSLSASATGKPILLVYNEKAKLTDSQITYLESLEDNAFCVIGGENAVGEKLYDAVAKYGSIHRLAGANRFDTSVQVAVRYFKNPSSAVLAYARNYPDGLCGGPLAYAMGAPLILTMTKYESDAKGYIAKENILRGSVLGGTGLISNKSVRSIFAMEPDSTVYAK